jgi:hypothetical protein
MDLATFRIRYPEFSLAQDAYVQSFLTAATNRLDADAFTAAQLIEAIGLLAAHLMAVTPAGMTAGMSNRFAESSYGKEFNRFCREVLGGAQVI